MINLKKTDLKKNTLQYDVTVPQKDIQKHYEETFKKHAGNLTVEGFRKGKAPAEIAEKHISKEHVYNDALNALLPEIYKELVTQENIKPVTAPKVELVEAKDGQDWIIRFTVAEKPKVNLKSYKTAIEKLSKESKKDAIWTPGKEKETKPEDTEAQKREHLNKVFETLLKETEVEISDIILEEEVSKRLTQLVDDVRKIGLTIENYLKSKNETIDTMKAKIQKEVEEMYKLEYVLDEIATVEKITVEQKDLDQVFENIKDPKGLESAKQNAYFYASLMKRQKTLDLLASL
jgi:trigger factor